MDSTPQDKTALLLLLNRAGDIDTAAHFNSKRRVYRFFFL
jgi:hypothetical protein